MKYSSQHRGYIFLLSVLVVGTISLAVTASVLLLSTSAARTGLSLKHSSEALALAQACAEHALLQLRSDSSYGGNELLDQGNTARRMEILVSRLLPSVTITSWQEVSLFTSCSY